MVDVKVLSIINCQAAPATVDLVERTAREIGVRIHLIHVVVATRQDAERYAFPGSPTVLVNGRDIDPPIQTCVSGDVI